MKVDGNNSVSLNIESVCCMDKYVLYNIIALLESRQHRNELFSNFPLIEFVWYN